MNTDELKKSLQDLHAQLGTTADVDVELKNLLQILDRDINQLLGKGELVSEDLAGLAQQAQSISARFAAQHPTIEPTLRELGNMLANMGI